MTTLLAPDDRVEQIERKVLQLTARVDAIDNRPTDIAKIRFTPSVVAAILTMTLSVAGGVWASNAGQRAGTTALRSDVRDILTRMETSAKLVDERATALREAVDAVKRRQELHQYEIQRLNEAILRLSPSSLR